MKAFWPILFLATCLSTSCQPGNDKNEQEATTAVASGRTKEANSTPRINCFAYHRFGNATYPSTNISLERFEGHLQFLKNNGYTVLPLGDALERMEEGHQGEKLAALTIDDGYSSVLSGALPLLEEYGYKATIFICTDQVGKGNSLSWKALQDLQQKGHEIGHHSHSHEHFLDHPPEEIAEAFEEDLRQGEALFREQLGKVPDLYAYPYGEYTSSMQEVLREYDYRAAAAQRSGVIGPESDRFALPRFPMAAQYGRVEKFREKASMHPLGVTREDPADVILRDRKPPTLRITVEEPAINPNGLQCFVDGRQDCSLTVVKEDPLVLEVKATRDLTDRRTLYTITAPSRDGTVWHWYSHLWVRPGQPE